MKMKGFHIDFPHEINSPEFAAFVVHLLCFHYKINPVIQLFIFMEKS